MQDLTLTTSDGLRLEAAVHSAQNDPIGTVIAAHGITVDLDEGGMFRRLAEALSDAGFTVLRFSFRGHGRSDGKPEGMTIAGELLDLQAAWDWATTQTRQPVSVIAASFGAVSASLSLPYLDSLSRLVLWNPVLDLRDTFVEPRLPWGLENFGPQQQAELYREGRLLIDGEFPIGWPVFEEFKLYRPDLAFQASKVPALVLHGDCDTYVSYEVARRAAQSREACRFHTVAGSGHGWSAREHEDEAITVTVEWLRDELEPARP